MTKITKFRRGLNTRIIKIPGPPNFFLSGSFPSPSSLSTASEVKESQFEHLSVLRCKNCHRCLPNELEGLQGLCFSTIWPCRALFTAGNTSTALVPITSTLTSGQTSIISSRPRAFNERQSCTPFDQPSIGCMGTISQHY